MEDAKFPAEIGFMGSGIQMWLQIIWFICRSQGSETIILDEPDVYMHPDLQLKLLQLVKSLFKQVIIATHSVEIISNVPPRNIVTIDKQDRQMRYANHLVAVQNIVDDIGSAYNLSLSKLSSAKKCVFVEGEDIKILQQFQDILTPNSISSLDAIPSLPLGGFTRISEAFGASKLFYESTSGQFQCFAILDRDYYTKSYLDEQLNKAKENHLSLHIWEKKEIENYIIKPPVLFRLLKNTKEDFPNFIQKYEYLIDTFKNNIIDSYTTKFQENDRRLTAGAAASMAREHVNLNWSSLEDKLNIIPGKDLLRATNKWMKENYKINCSMRSIFDVMRSGDIDTEIVEVLNKLN
ncbi:AAA family ATPase [Desulfitobacterium sp.]|uniref:AAA family ATPase n=1 Tax=Desulfitobacterium sp. TaxID=49981 RepID=UPI002B3AB71F|nr:AAA family ATPase [Desulfitobacterium sp.]